MTDTTNKMEQPDVNLKARQEEGREILEDQMKREEESSDRPEEPEEKFLDDLESGKEKVSRADGDIVLEPDQLGAAEDRKADLNKLYDDLDSGAPLKARLEEGGRLLADQQRQRVGETDRPEDIESDLNKFYDNLDSGKETIIRIGGDIPISITEDTDRPEEPEEKFLDDLESGKEKVSRAAVDIILKSDKIEVVGDIVSQPEEYNSDGG